jgi:hypothetical protein
MQQYEEDGEYRVASDYRYESKEKQHITPQ